MKTGNLSELNSDDLKNLVERVSANKEVAEASRKIVDTVKKNGFNAIVEFSEKFDNFKITKQNAFVGEEEIKKSEVGNAEKSLKLAYENIKALSESQKSGKTFYKAPGIEVWLDLKKGKLPIGAPLKRIGVYVPGGKAPLPSSLLMAVIPAKVAGVEEIVVCTPFDKNFPEGISPGILYAAKLCGIERIYKIGGAQAIAAMAFGVPELDLPSVPLIAGPGNAYVTSAKKYVSKKFKKRIDVPAGPSEILVIADSSANPKIVAADLLSQAEHGIYSASICLTPDSNLGGEIFAEVNKQVEALPRSTDIKIALKNYGAVLTVNSIEEAIQFSNNYAPEHLELCIDNPEQYYKKINSVGAVFVNTGEVYGDYGMSGSNHILPTGRTAKKYSGVSVFTFSRKTLNAKYILYQKISPEMQKKLASIAAEFARLEGLEAHARAAEARLSTVRS